MKLTIRRIGNSLGAIIPRAVLERLGLGEGDQLEVDERSLGAVHSGLSKPDLDQLRLERALAVVRHFTPGEIRAKGLANLHRWKRAGSWGRAYDEWEDILRDS